MDDMSSWEITQERTACCIQIDRNNWSANQVALPRLNWALKSNLFHSVSLWKNKDMVHQCEGIYNTLSFSPSLTWLLKVPIIKHKPKCKICETQPRFVLVKYPLVKTMEFARKTNLNSKKDRKKRLCPFSSWLTQTHTYYKIGRRANKGDQTQNAMVHIHANSQWVRENKIISF